MQALNFPHENLVIGQIHRANGLTFKWDGTKWDIVTTVYSINTDRITEGSANLFFTEPRVWESLTGSGIISVDSSTGVISATSENVEDILGASVSAGSGISVSYADNGANSGVLTISATDSVARTDAAETFERAVTVTSGGLTLTSGTLAVSSGGATIAGDLAVAGGAFVQRRSDQDQRGCWGRRGRKRRRRRSHGSRRGSQQRSGRGRRHRSRPPRRDGQETHLGRVGRQVVGRDRDPRGRQVRGRRISGITGISSSQVSGIPASTDDVSEGSGNLYLTRERVEAMVSGYATAGDGMSVEHADGGGGADTLTFAVDSSVARTDAAETFDMAVTVASGGLTLTSGTLTVTSGDVALTAGDMTLSSGDLTVGEDLSVSGNVVVSGNLTVAGTTTTVNSETVNIADNVILINSNFASGTPTQDGGIEISRGDSANKQLIWDESEDKWSVGSDTIVAGKFEGDGSGITGIASSQISGLPADTDDLSEGSTNLWFTEARAREAAGAKIGASAPSNPSAGDLWWNSETAELFIHYSDGTDSAWMPVVMTVEIDGVVTASSDAVVSVSSGVITTDDANLATEVDTIISAGTGITKSKSGNVVTLANAYTITASATAPASPAVNDLWINTESAELFFRHSDGTDSAWLGIASANAGTGGFTRMAAIATDSGTEHDFTGIPAGTRIVDIVFDQVSIDGGDDFLIQIGDAGGIEDAEYDSGSPELGDSVGGSAEISTTGYAIYSNNAGYKVTGTVRLHNVSGNIWVASGIVYPGQRRVESGHHGGGQRAQGAVGAAGPRADHHGRRLGPLRRRVRERVLSLRGTRNGRDRPARQSRRGGTRTSTET